MKKKQISAPLAVFIFMISSVLTLQSGAAQSGEPIAYCKFDDGCGNTAVDSSDNGNTGTLVNNPSWTNGRIIIGLEKLGVQKTE